MSSSFKAFEFKKGGEWHLPSIKWRIFFLNFKLHLPQQPTSRQAIQSQKSLLGPHTKRKHQDIKRDYFPSGSKVIRAFFRKFKKLVISNIELSQWICICICQCLVNEFLLKKWTSETYLESNPRRTFDRTDFCDEGDFLPHLLFSLKQYWLVERCEMK